jgi:hypothetical protein
MSSSDSQPDSQSESKADSPPDSQREKFLRALARKKGKGATPGKGGSSAGPKVSGAQRRGGIPRQNVQRKSGGA